MRSPHPSGYGPYQDPYTLRTLPAVEEGLIAQSYTFLGWNPNARHITEFMHCLDLAHNYHSSFPNAWHSEQHTPSGSDVTQWCTICKTYWKVDMSD